MFKVLFKITIIVLLLLSMFNILSYFDVTKPIDIRISIAGGLLGLAAFMSEWADRNVDK